MRENSIESLFERLRRDIEVNDEPLFWLQYAILMIDKNQLDTAEGFINTAYDRGSKNPDFRNFQIDTMSFRLVLMIETKNSNSSTVERFEDLIYKGELVLSMISDASHRSFAIKVFDGVEGFTYARVRHLDTDQKNKLVYFYNRVVYALETLSTEVKMETGSERLKLAIERSIKMVII